MSDKNMLGRKDHYNMYTVVWLSLNLDILISGDNYTSDGTYGNN
jgi:hypothetical protein